MTDLLTTKLFLPHRHPNIVERTRLTERLMAGMDRKLTLISAPAGFGKTTLLSEWIPQSDHCVTWVSLDEGGNDPARFWAYFIAALEMLNVEQPVGTIVLTVVCTFNPHTSDGSVPGGTVSCISS